MTDKRKPTKVDPELVRQLDEADSDDAPVQVVVFLSSGLRGSPSAITRQAEKVIGSAKSKSGTEPSRVNVMRNLGTVALEAPASFVRALLDEDDVESAVANIQPDDDVGIGVPSGSSTKGASVAADDAAEPDEADADEADADEEA